MSEPKPATFEIHRIYIKDLSFESPQSPAIFKENTKFAVDVSVDSKAVKLDGDFHEVTLMITVTAKNDGAEDVAYIAEAKQAGIFTVSGFKDEERKQILNSACANILFPYVREAISDLVNRGGFPQLYLAPINFDALYQQQQEAAAQEDTKEALETSSVADDQAGETTH